MRQTDDRAPLFDEQTKRLASALNTAAGSRFALGNARPVAWSIYTFGNIRGVPGVEVLALGAFGWLSAAASLNPVA